MVAPNTTMRLSHFHRPARITPETRCSLPLSHTSSLLVRQVELTSVLPLALLLHLLCLFLPAHILADQHPSWPPFPTVPSSYDSHVSLFFPLSSFSLSYRDYFSSNSSLLRRDHHFSKADSSEYIHYQPNDESITVVNATTGECSIHSLLAEQSAHLFYRPSSHMLELLSSVESWWSYKGATRAIRNTTAHHWKLENVTITSAGALCTYNVSDPNSEQCVEPSDFQPSFSQLVDQTVDLSTDMHFSYSHISIDYYVHEQPVIDLDGSVPLRVVVSGRRSDRSGRFTHYFDWLQFKPLDLVDLYFDTINCSLSVDDYTPGVPRSLAPDDAVPSSHPSQLPKMPASFTMLVEEQTSLYDERTNEHSERASGAMLWTRLNNTLESTQYLDSLSVLIAPDGGNHSSLRSTTLYYNYSSSPPMVWSVNSSSCSVQRVTPWNSNPLASPIPVTFLALFKSDWWIDPHPMPLSYQFAGWQEVHGVMCMHYRAVKQMKLADPANFWLYNSSVFLAPPSWQHPDEDSYQLPVQMINTGSDFYYHDKKNKTNEHDHDKDKDKEKEKKRDDDDENDEHDAEKVKVHGSADDDEDENEDQDSAGKQKQKSKTIPYDVNCTTEALPAELDMPTPAPAKEPCLPRSELPSQRSFSEVWDIYGLYSPVSLQAFDIEALGCPTALTPHFPPMPLGYSSSVVVSSTLTTQVYAYTEYVDFRFGQRVDGRFHGRDSIEVTHTSGLSVLYDNPLMDEAAYGYGSREDYSTHPTLASFTPALDGRAQAACKRQSKFHYGQMTAQFVSPMYLYYLAQYPPTTWVHADPSTLDGMLVDQWQAINQSTTVDGDLIFDTAILYFSHADTLYDGQVPLRFEISKVMIATSSDESQTVLESTVVDFVQWSALECTFSCYMTLFSLPPVHDCPVDTFDTRYATLFSALAAPAQPAEYITLPTIPESFTAVILTRLNESSSQLYALRWYVDEENDRDRLDWAPVNSHATLYSADHHSILYYHEDDWGAYELNTTGACTSLNMSSLDAVNPLLLHHSGSLPDLFDDDFDDASVLQADKVDGVDVVCFQKHYHGLLNRYTNRTYSFARQACFAQQNWVAYPSGQQRQLTSVVDSGTYTYWSSEAQSTLEAEFVADYDVLFVEADVPAAALFNLTSYRCAASGIMYVDPDDDDDDGGDGHSAPATLTLAEALGVAALAGVVVTALVYMGKQLWQRRQVHSSDVLLEPLQSLSTSDSFDGLSAAALAASLGDGECDAGRLDARDGPVKPSLIM